MTTHDRHFPTPTVQTEPREPGRWRSIIVVTACVLLAAALVMGGKLLIEARAAVTNHSGPETPVAVSVISVVPASGYVQTSRHIGLVEPTRQTALAFETSGTLAQLHVGEGERVTKGQLIASLDTRALQTERASQLALRDAVSSDLERSQLALERQQTLEARDFTAGQSLDDARLLVTRSKALMEQADAAISTIDVALDKATLRAPFDAQVGSQSVDEGSTVNPGIPVAMLFEWRPPVVRVGLPVESGSTLQPQSKHTILIGVDEYPASVISVRNDLSARTRTIDVRLQLDTNHRPWPVFGRTAELLLEQRIEQPGYWVPVNALTEGESGLWSVLQSVPDEPGDTIGRVVRKHVDIVHTDGKDAYVLGKLSSEAGLIRSGTHRVVAGQRVQIKADEQ